MPANTASIVTANGLRMNSNFQVFLFKKYIYKTIDAIDGDSSDGSGKSQLKIFWIGYTIPDALRTFVVHWEEVKMSALIGVWKKLISVFIPDFEGFKTSVEEIIDDMVKTARELESEAEAKDVTELLRSHDKTVANEEFLLMDEQRKWFL